MMVRAMGHGDDPYRDYLVDSEQGERLRDRLREADELPPEQRNAAVRELIAELARDGTEAPQGLDPDLVLMTILVTVEPPPESVPLDQPSPPDDGTHYYRDPDDPRYDLSDEPRPGSGGHSGGRPHNELRDIDDTDRWRD